MLDAQAVLSRARDGNAPATWRVFTKKRGKVRGFLLGTSADPDPMLVITPAGVAEYADSKKPVTAASGLCGVAGPASLFQSVMPRDPEDLAL